MGANNSLTGRYPEGEGVLVTGCSSGIGRATALHLARRGFVVFASVRKESDVENLRALNQPNLVPVCPLDLSRPEHISPVVETVEKELSARGIEGLYAVVNNAGGGFIAPVELMDLAKLRTELETRIVGPIGLVQTLLPLIRAARGRILWISTPAMVAIPYVASIHACEFAMNCIAQNLHLELMPWGIPNILIGCGGIKTAAPDRTARELEDSLRQWPREQVELYAQALRKLQGDFSAFDTRRSTPEEVAEVVFEALCAKRPKRKYLVGHQARAMAMLRFLPQTLIDAVFAKRF